MEVIVRSMVVVRGVDGGLRQKYRCNGAVSMDKGYVYGFSCLGVVEYVLWEGERKSRLIRCTHEANTEVGYSAGGANRRSRVATGR